MDAKHPPSAPLSHSPLFRTPFSLEEPGESSTRQGKIGICVLTYNSQECLIACLSALQSALDGTQAAVVCVDNASAEDPAELVLQGFPGAAYIRNSRNLGYSAGNNVGARHLLAQGCDLLAFLNPDVLVAPDTLDKMRAVLELDSANACVGGVVLTTDDFSDRSFRREPTWADFAIHYGTLRHLPILRQLLRPLHRRLLSRHFIPLSGITDGQPVYALAGACILFRAEAFTKVGALDERSFLYGEEFMMAEALRRAGYRVVAAPSAHYAHVDGGSSEDRGPQMHQMLRREFARSTGVYLRHYRGWKTRATLIDTLYRFERGCWGVAGFLRGLAKGPR